MTIRYAKMDSWHYFTVFIIAKHTQHDMTEIQGNDISKGSNVHLYRRFMFTNSKTINFDNKNNENANYQNFKLGHPFNIHITKKF